MKGTILLLLLVLLPMAGALLSFGIGKIHKTYRDYVAWFFVILEFSLMIWAFFLFVRQGTLELLIPDICMMGLHFQLDGFRGVFGIIAAFMWMMTTLFSKEYLEHYRNRNRYYFFILMTLGATMGVFLSADLFTTFIFFEMMSFTSYVWVAQEENMESLRAAGTYLAVAVIGGLVLLMGLFLLYSLTGTLEMSKLLEAGRHITDKKLLYTAGGLILFGFGAKAGMFPLHIWLPKAHPVAPAPASALLSGILTKTGVFGILIISCNLFFHDRTWGMAVLLLGVITMFLGAFVALFSVNLKRTLALSSMSQIGFILVGVGMTGLLGEENGLAVRGTLLHMVNHSLIKLVLFMIAGVVAMNLHKLDLNEIRGFGKNKPLLKFGFLMGALGIGGIPLWNGYISKTLLHESIVEYIELSKHSGMHLIYQGVEWIFLLTGGLTVAYMMKLFIAVFVETNPYSQEKMEESNHHYMNRVSAIVITLSAVLLPLLGLLPYLTMDRISSLAEPFFRAEGDFHKVHYFTLVNLRGALISIGIGIAVYVFIVRKLLMGKDAQGNLVYINRWPEWMDMEDTLYRPVVLLLLPAIGSFFSELLNYLLDIFLCFILPIASFLSRVLDYFLDSLIAMGRMSIWRDAKEHPAPVVGTRFTFVLGSIMDSLHHIKQKMMHQETDDEVSYIYQTAKNRETIQRTVKIISASMSFGLLLVCVGLCFTLIYLLIHQR